MRIESHSVFDIGFDAGRDVGRVEERARINAIMGTPEALRHADEAARLALQTGIAAPDARRVLAQMASPQTKKGRGR